MAGVDDGRNKYNEDNQPDNNKRDKALIVAQVLQSSGQGAIRARVMETMRGWRRLYTRAFTCCYACFIIIAFRIAIGMPRRPCFARAWRFGNDRYLRVFLVFFIRSAIEIGGRALLWLLVLVLL